MSLASQRYRVEFAPAARRQLRKLDRQVARRVFAALEGLQAEPQPDGCRAMVDQKDRWRIQVAGAGDHRIVYEVHDDQLLVLVVTVAHRKEVYR